MLWRKRFHDKALKNSVFDLSLSFLFSFLMVPISSRLTVFHLVCSISFLGSITYLIIMCIVAVLLLFIVILAFIIVFCLEIDLIIMCIMAALLAFIIFLGRQINLIIKCIVAVLLLLFTYSYGSFISFLSFLSYEWQCLFCVSKSFTCSSR